MMDKYHPGYFGKVGMRHFNLRKNGYHCPSVNLDKLWALVGGPDSEAVKKASGGGAPVIDLTQFGLFKLLGKGQLPDKPVVVRAKFVSKRAEEKVRAVGGAVELIARGGGEVFFLHFFSCHHTRRAHGSACCCLLEWECACARGVCVKKRR